MLRILNWISTLGGIVKWIKLIFMILYTCLVEVELTRNYMIKLKFQHS